MLEGLTLDQFLVFMTVVEEGSFSGAGRKLGRAQSAITYAIKCLEQQTGADLFDRSTYRPTLTSAGRVLLPRVQRVLESVAGYRTQAQGLLAGIEARLTVAIDIAVDTGPLERALAAFKQAFPFVEIVMLVQTMDLTFAALHDGIADLGLVVDVPATDLLEGLERTPCGRLLPVLVAAPDHPLARLGRALRTEDLRDYVQILLSAGPEAKAVRDWGVYAVNRWRVNDIGLRRRLLCAGLGWSSMPYHLVNNDLMAGRLVKLEMDKTSVNETPPELVTSVAYPRDRLPGVAGQWLFQQILTQSL